MPVTKRVDRVRARLSEDVHRLNTRRVRPLLIKAGRIVNDIHSQLNPTRVCRVIQPDSLESLQDALGRVRAEGRTICVAGGRHAMGGQQFGTDGGLVDTSRMNRVLRFDATRHEVEVEAGIQWPKLIADLSKAHRGRDQQFGIIQKQTGADCLSLGGALSANIHGRGLALKPIINDVESFVIVDAEGKALTCSRRENTELFRLVIGGYGLFGIIAHVTLRLAPRRRLERVVEITDLDELMHAFEQRISDGFLYGDFQFMTDSESNGFLRRGVFSCYRPATGDLPLPASQKELSPNDWNQLLHLAHTDRERAFEVYARHYLSTNGQNYWSDTHQLSVYLDDYHRELDSRLGSATPGSEMITEVYVPRDKLVDFMKCVRADFRANKTELIYGTIRLIERDEESFLAWAKEPYACIVFNLHVTHDRPGIDRAKRDFRLLLDRAIERGGSYYLTYHRWATREHVLACYPKFPEFLRLKLKYDPKETFQSDWYGHHRSLLSRECAVTFPESSSSRTH